MPGTEGFDDGGFLRRRLPWSRPEGPALCRRGDKRRPDRAFTRLDAELSACHRLNPKNNVVDITNFVLHELGQRSTLSMPTGLPGAGW